jgi:hypothetical protein
METSTYKITLKYNQVLELVKQLPVKEKAKLSKELAKEAIDHRLSKLLNSFATDELTDDSINEEIESIRSEIYASKK